MKRKMTTTTRTIFISAAMLFFSSLCLAGENPLLQDQKSTRKFKESYSLGYEFGTNLKSRGVDTDIDMDVLLSAVRDAMEGKEPALSSFEVRETLSQIKKRLMIVQDRRWRESAAKNLEQSKAFMEENKGKEGVISLKSGLQYKVITEGKGKSPTPSDVVKVSYRGRLTDGTEFDGSHGPDGPLVSRADGIMQGWTEALQLMKTGSKWQIFVPPWLGFGEKKFRGVPPNSVLVYEVELLSVGEIPDYATAIPEGQKRTAGH